MDLIKINKITVNFDANEKETAGLIAGACQRSIELAAECWGLSSPQDCRIFIMRSAIKFLFQSAPWSWRIYLGIALPLWYRQVNRIWQYAGAWTQRFGKRIVIGIKPPYMIEKSDQSIGVRLFVEEPDINKKIQQFTCHELVHACSSHLRLPMWLNEGIAIVTVDRFVGEQTVRMDTLDLIKNVSAHTQPPAQRELFKLDKEKIAYHTIRGYWLVKYIEELHPGLLKNLFSQSPDSKSINEKIITALKMDPATFWANIDEVLVRHFEDK
ncbi:MAG: hypothetical protein A2Z74_04625 [Chloroflexi bacterium RBG_13_46_9]|nr:MAG: hypothetical protein A2Z74_04625 [Chloroflexi bacterium RBG_13_46_9]